MSKIIDLEQVQLVIDERRKMLEHQLDGDTEQAVIARHEVEVASVMTIWRSKEINRHTDRRHLIKALMLGAVASIGGHILTDVPDPEMRPIVAIGICQEMLRDLLNLLDATDEERAEYSRTVAPIEGGRA